MQVLSQLSYGPVKRSAQFTTGAPPCQGYTGFFVVTETRSTQVSGQ
jgi:hypothetical protein